MRDSVASARIPLLGASVHALTMDEWTELVSSAVQAREPVIVASLNLHGVHSFHRSDEMRRLHGQAFVRLDGMPLVAWARVLGHDLQRAHRLTWVDWLPHLFRRAQLKGWRVFYLGSHPDKLARGIAKVREQFPQLRISGHHGYVNTEEANALALAQIDAAAPDILLVGMGMPAQERWVLQHATEGRLAPAVLTCGAAIEYFSGDLSTPPRWTGRLGLEGVYRLLSSPRRTWRRYLVEPWGLMPHALADLRRARAAGRRGN